MARDELSRRHLVTAFDEFNKLRPPLISNSGLDVQDADVDMHEEGGYLAGLVGRALKGAELGVLYVHLDGSIDERIGRAQAPNPTAARMLTGLQRYREKMLELANLLGRFCEVQVRRG